LEQNEVTPSLFLINENFPNEHIFEVSQIHETLGFVDFANYLACGIIPRELTYQQRKKFLHDSRHYFWEDPFLFKQYANNIIRKCVAKSEIAEIFYHFHSSLSGGHFGSSRTIAKILQSGFFWPTIFKDAYAYVKTMVDAKGLKYIIEEQDALGKYFRG